MIVKEMGMVILTFRAKSSFLVERERFMNSNFKYSHIDIISFTELQHLY